MIEYHPIGKFHTSLSPGTGAPRHGVLEPDNKGIIEVLPEYQKRGIGKELVERMLNELSNLYMIDLTCDKNLVKFYEKFGMLSHTAMMVRNFERQSC